jgi:hypothetical protein
MSNEQPVLPTPANLKRFGIARISRGDAIRAMCLQCMGGSSNDVKLCVSSPCPLWPFRLGTDPFAAKREMSPEQRAAAVERLARARQA